MTDHAPTEERPRYPLPPAPARHLPVAQPDSRYSRGVVPLEASWAHTELAILKPHPVDVRPEYRPRHRTDPAPYAARPIAKAQRWERWPTAYGLGVLTGAVALFEFFMLMRLISS